MERFSSSRWIPAPSPHALTEAGSASGLDRGSLSQKITKLADLMTSVSREALAASARANMSCDATEDRQRVIDGRHRAAALDATRKMFADTS